MRETEIARFMVEQIEIFGYYARDGDAPPSSSTLLPGTGLNDFRERIVSLTALVNLDVSQVFYIRHKISNACFSVVDTVLHRQLRSKTPQVALCPEKPRVRGPPDSLADATMILSLPCRTYSSRAA